MVDTLTQELESLKLTQAQQLGRIELEHAKKISDDREKYNADREKARIEAERNARELEYKYQDQVLPILVTKYS